MKNCSNCAYYTPRKEYLKAPVMVCEHSELDAYIKVRVADDHGLDTWFTPPDWFSCALHKEVK